MQSTNWLGASVLLSGATGFFGGWLASALVARGAKVTAIVRSRKPESQFFQTGLDQQVAIEWGSLSDPPFLRDVIRRTQPDYFFHSAYGGDVNRVLADPLDCFESSVVSTWVALEELRRMEGRCVSVVSSSDKAYGAQELPYEEHKPLEPRHPYEVAKASMDLAAQSYGKIYGMPVGVTRSGNYFGAFDFNATRLIPGAVRSITAGEPPVLRSNGRFTRDFMYVGDAADAHILLAEQLSHRPELYGEAFNFSYGEQIEVIDLVRRILAISGSSLEPMVQASVKAEIPHMMLSSQKARSVLGWRPTLGFDEGLRRTVEWYLSYWQEQNAKSEGHPLSGAAFA